MRRIQNFTAGLTLVAAMTAARHVHSEDAADGEPNVEFATLGGAQFWSDELIHGDWRIQRHTYTNHCRLLDEKDVRQGWGTFDQCRTKFDALYRERKLPPLNEKVVIFAHGLMRTRGSFHAMGGILHEQGGFQPLHFGYASSRAGVDAHAAALAKVLANLDGPKEIHFVAHSLGNLVIRRMLAMAAESGSGVDARIGRIVMLGPPNHGSQLAATFKDNLLMGMVWGESAKEIADFSNLEKRLAVPLGEFGVISGRTRLLGMSNPLVAGDDDLVVSVRETQLAGARDYRMVDVVHMLLMDDPGVQRFTLRFLRDGCFETDDRRRPIE